MATGGNAEYRAEEAAGAADGTSGQPDRAAAGEAADGDPAITAEVADRVRLQELAERIRKEASRAFGRNE